jgi:hypothetical protein
MPLNRVVLFSTLAALGTPSWTADFLPSAQSPQWVLYTEGSAFAVSDFAPLRSLASDWTHQLAPRTGRNVAIADARLESGASLGRWRMGMEYRTGSALSTSADTLRLIQRYQTKQAPATTESFELDAQWRSWRSAGLTAQYQVLGNLAATPQDASPATVALKASVYLQPSAKNVSAQGQAQYFPNNSLALAAQYQGQNSDYRYPFMGAVSSAATGISLSASGELMISPHSRIEWQANDVLSRLRLNRVPGFDKRYSTATASLDAQGYVNYAALMQAQSGQSPYSFSLKPSGHVRWRQQITPNWAGTCALNTAQSITYVQCGAHYHHTLGQFSAQYASRFKLAMIGYEGVSGFIRLGADRFNLQQAKALSLTAGSVWAF